MSKLTRSQFDDLYNQSASGSFKNNVTQSITADVIRQFAKDIEDSFANLSESNQFDAKISLGSTSAGAVPDASILGIKSYFSTNDASIFHINAYFQTEQSVATTNSIQGIEGYTKVTHASGTVALAIGTLGNLEIAGAGNLTLGTCIGGGFVINGAGTIGTFKNFNAQSANLGGGGGVTTAYMFYGDVYPSGVTTKYGICIADTTAGNGFGVTDPSALIDILGSSTAKASLRIRQGTAPTSPNDGDMWYDGTNVKFRAAGATKTFNFGSGGSASGNNGAIQLSDGSGSFTSDLGLSWNTGSKYLYILNKNSSTGSGVITQLRISGQTTLTPGLGIGARLEFETQTSTTPTLRLGSTIDSISTNIGSGTEAFDLVFSNMIGGGTALEKARITSLGDFKLNTVGGGHYVKEGSNATMGVATLSGGTATVNTTKVTANSRIFISDQGGTITNLGTIYVSARTAGTSFTVSSTNVLDASTFCWIIFEPS